MSGSFFDTFSIKLVVSEASLVCYLFIGIVSVLTFSLIFVEITFVIRSVFKDKNSPAFSLSMIKVSNVETSVLFVHSSETVWTSAFAIKLADICISSVSSLLRMSFSAQFVLEKPLSIHGFSNSFACFRNFKVFNIFVIVFLDLHL